MSVDPTELLKQVALSPITSFIACASGVVLFVFGPTAQPFHFIALAWLAIGSSGFAAHLIVRSIHGSRIGISYLRNRSRIAAASKPRDKLIQSLSREELATLNTFYSHLSPEPTAYRRDRHDPQIVHLVKTGVIEEVYRENTTDLDGAFCVRPWAYDSPFRQQIESRIMHEFGVLLGQRIQTTDEPNK